MFFLALMQMATEECAKILGAKNTSRGSPFESSLKNSIIGLYSEKTFKKTWLEMSKSFCGNGGTRVEAFNKV